MAAAPLAAQAPAKIDLNATVRLAVNRGELLYIYDRAAWLGTDDFTGHHQHLIDQTGGYVVTGEQARTELVFFDKSKSKAIYRATFVDDSLTSSGLPEAELTELTPLEKQMISAKDSALQAFIEAKVALCANANPNVTALPPEKPGEPILVYMMTPQTDLKKFPLGGHYSVEVDSAGKAGEIREFANSCIDMPIGQLTLGARPAAFVIAHLLDPTPTEIHVFTSLTSNVPLIVVTIPDARMWSVDGNRVAMQGSAKKQ